MFMSTADLRSAVERYFRVDDRGYRIDLRVTGSGSCLVRASNRIWLVQNKKNGTWLEDLKQFPKKAESSRKKEQRKKRDENRNAKADWIHFCGNKYPVTSSPLAGYHNVSTSFSCSQFSLLWPVPTIGWVYRAILLLCITKFQISNNQIRCRITK